MAANAGTASGKIVWSGANLGRNIEVAQSIFEGYVVAIMTRGATNGQNYMRENAPWTDRTGNARGGLFAQYVNDGDSHTIVMYHTMPYGVYLEFKDGGRYKIIEPALRHTGLEVMGTFQGLLERIRV